MAKKKVVKSKTKSIITGYLEKISKNVFIDYSKVITDMIQGHQGIYALYKNDRLYYVGLASDLKKRIKHHLNDKHKGQWTHFSLYIVRQTDHIKEIESMILRIAYPKGNTVKGKLTSKNLRPLLKTKLRAEWQRQFGDLLGKPQAKKAKTARTTKAPKAPTTPRPLKGLLKNYQRIYAAYKGYEYKAKVLPSGQIEIIGSKERFDSPSGAGKFVRGGKSTNGWRFWKYKNAAGELVPLANLLK